MYLNTNMSALQAIQALSNTSAQENQTLGQLSTGNKITSAASNPAGLAISELMQSQINGLNQSSHNAQNGVSLLQTADGAMSNIDTILQSMYSLASQAATGTNNSNDLKDLQAEMNQYSKEITNISNTTQFNNINLLDGGFQNQAIQIGAQQGQALSLSINSMDSVSLKVAGYSAAVSSNAAGLQTSTLSLGAGLTVGSKYEVQLTAASAAAVSTITQSADFGTAATSEVTGTFGGSATTTYSIAVTTNSAGSFIYAVTGSDGYSNSIVTSAALAAITINDTAASASLTFTPASSTTIAAGDTASFTMTPGSATYALADGSGTPVNGGTPITVSGQAEFANTITVGDTSSGQTATGQVVSFSIATATAAGLTSVGGTSVTTGNTVFTVGYNGQTATLVPGSVSLSTTDYASANTGVNISTQASAQVAMTTIGNAIQIVDNQRANVGAKVNRLTFAQNNAKTEATNLQQAYAGYMNTNMPAATAKFMQQQVLVQADVGLLSQAEQLPSNLLKLIP